MKRSRGFTLVEILVAVGITAVLAAVMLNLITQTLNLWTRSASALATENQATLVLDRLVHDLESAVVRTQAGGEWIRQNEGGAAGTNVLRIFAQTHNTSGDRSDPSTIREVTYRLEMEGSGNRLYRLEGTAADALENGYAFATNWPPNSAAEFLLAEGVVRLDMSFFDDLTTANNMIDAAHWPALVKIELQLVSADGTNRLAAVENGLSNETRQQILDETADEFVRWIELGGRPW